MALFGLGSIVGAFAGGWLSDKIGHFWVQFISLTAGGALFLAVANLTDFAELSLGIFAISAISEMLRPANQASVASYAKPENVTRAFSLNRMAVNLGYSVGPALGGLLATFSYKLLFIADGITCLLAGVLFFFYFRNKKPRPITQPSSAKGQSTREALTNWRFVLFVLLVLSFATVFFQLFMTLPLYYKEVYSLPEGKIGLLIGLNGLIVFLLEMVLVYLIGNKFSLRRLIMIGSIMNGLSYMLLNLFDAEAVLYVAVFVISIAEIMSMPFMATYTIQSSGEKNRGIYLGMYSFAYSAAFVLAPAFGTWTVSHWGFETLWWLCGVLSVFSAAGFYLLMSKPALQAEVDPLPSP
jgi:predicted MFS family arabinose efflux permease